MIEEFGTGTATSGQIGQTGVGFTAVAVGTLTTPDSEANHPGIVRLNSHATNDDSGISLQWWNGSGHWIEDIESEEFDIEALVKLGANSTAITSTSITFGFANVDGYPGSSTNAIWIRRDTDLSDTAFIFPICDNSGSAGCQSAGDNTDSNTVGSTITPTAGNWYRLRIRRVASGVGGNPTLYFSVSDETEKTMCSSGCNDTLSNLPAFTRGKFQVAYLTRTKTGVMSADVDYLVRSVTGLSRY